jgi:hypothetical protein
MRTKILKQHIFFTPAEIRLPRTRWLKVAGNSRKSSGRVSLADFRLPTNSGMMTGKVGETASIRRFCARVADPAGVWMSAIAMPLMLIAPALWNGYPLLQWDTGGYLARWHEGYRLSRCCWSWVATFVVLISLVRHFADDEPRDNSLSL